MTERCPTPYHPDRRTFLALLATGVASVLSGCGSASRHGRQSAGHVGGSGHAADSQLIPSSTTTVPPLPAIPPARPGPPSVVMKAPHPTRQIALTIDDGYCRHCVDAYVAFAEESGIHLTFSPNGTFHQIWDDYAKRLAPLIALGQVQIANHTWSHKDLLKLSTQQVRDEIQRNEAWIEKTFGTTGRPWFRPPYGFHNRRVDETAGELGYTKILLWNGSFGDATLLTPDQLLHQADLYLKPGTIMLGHANHPTVTNLFDQIRRMIDDRNLEPVTLDTMFGSSRAVG